MKLIRTLSIVLAISLSMNVSHAKILISAAASLKDAFTQISQEFKKQEAISIALNFAGSGKLRAQIEHGAPVDIFASASMHHMSVLQKKKLIKVSSKKQFAKNSIVLVQNSNSKNKITAVDQLKDSEIKNIAMGNPQTVPAGRYAREALEHFRVFDHIKNKLIFAENVRQVRDYIEKNEVDAALMFSSDLITAKQIDSIQELPESSHEEIVYPIAIVENSKNVSDSNKFIAFLTGKQGKAILKQYGFK